MNPVRHFDEIAARDEEARRLAQREFHAPLVLEAGAGTGKTTTLTARILAWCTGPGWTRAQEAINSAEPDRIAARVLDGVVAITFTEAAAAEMATRVGEALAEVERGGTSPGLVPDVQRQSPDLYRHRARALLGSLDHLVVMTIHAFCLRLLAQYPIEARLHPNFTVDADGLVVEQVVREVVEDALKIAYGEPGDPHFLAVAAEGHGPQEIAETLIVLASEAVPAEALREDPLSPDRVRAFCQKTRRGLGDFLDREGRCLKEVKRSPRTREVLACAEATLQQLDAFEASSLPHVQGLCALVRETWPGAAMDRLKDWEAGKLTQGERTALGPLAGELPVRVAPLRRLLKHVGRVDPQMLEHARLVLGPLLERVSGEMRSRGAQTFTGLLRDARDLLARHPDVRARVRRSIDQLLVDEFQDTDRLQCDIVRMLALEGPEVEQPGLFIVGDPKQSIYGWRNADLEAYDNFVEEVLGRGGERHLLAMNFRSAPVILEEVERAVRPVMHEQRGLQPAFQPLVPCPDRADSPGFAVDPRSPVEYWVSWARDEQGQTVADGTLSDEASEIESAALARDILALHHEHGVPWQEVGVLFRSTGDLDTYLTAFRQAEIPYVVARDKNYYRRREIIEAAALLRCILDPNDHVALITLLRSAMVGVPDAAWIPLWSRSFPELVIELHGEDAGCMARIETVVKEVADSLPLDIPGIQRVAGWERALLAAIQNLGFLRESFERDPADEFVARVRNLFLVEATEAARYLGAYRLANLERFFRHLSDALDQGGGDPQAILRALRAGVTQAREAEEGRPKEAAEEAVQVMTIHKAKGLDFRHVYVMQLHRGSRVSEDQETAAAWHGGRWEYTLFGVPTLDFTEVAERNRAVAHAELVRTLYVAMTRAKDRLVLAGRWPGGDSRKSPGRARTHMDLLQWRTGEPPPLAQLMQERAANGGTTYADASAARWVFLGLLGPERPLPFQATTVMELPSPERVWADTAAIAARVKTAQALMARPFSGAASEESHEALRELFAVRADPEERGAPATSLWTQGQGPDAARQGAMAVGNAMHRVLESFDLNTDPVEELQRQRARLPAYVSFPLGDPARDSALRRAESLLDRFQAGPLLPRFIALREHVVARELPVLLPPAVEGEGPVGFVAGAIDLLYRDPETGEFVVADYKTDEVDQPADIEERARAYASQGAVYVRAIREALNLPEDPRFELWFLHPGRIEVVA